MLGLAANSEFAGLPRAEQEAKLRQGLAIFAEHGVRADAWVAPSHSFDRTTVALLAGMGISVISDGLWNWPFTDPAGTVWVPQQLWQFHTRRKGIWTVCNHPNPWTAKRLAWFLGILAQEAPNTTHLQAVLADHAHRRLSPADRWVAFWRLRYYRVHSILYNLFRRLR